MPAGLRHLKVGLVPAAVKRSTDLFLQKEHKMDWARDNYEIYPNVGLNPIDVHVTYFIIKLGDSLK
jgi:hypothetical protein